MFGRGKFLGALAVSLAFFSASSWADVGGCGRMWADVGGSLQNSLVVPARESLTQAAEQFFKGNPTCGTPYSNNTAYYRSLLRSIMEASDARECEDQSTEDTTTLGRVTKSLRGVSACLTIVSRLQAVQGISRILTETKSAVGSLSEIQLVGQRIAELDSAARGLRTQLSAVSAVSRPLDSVAEIMRFSEPAPVDYCTIPNARATFPPEISFESSWTSMKQAVETMKSLVSTEEANLRRGISAIEKVISDQQAIVGTATGGLSAGFVSENAGELSASYCAGLEPGAASARPTFGQSGRASVRQEQQAFQRDMRTLCTSPIGRSVLQGSVSGANTSSRIAVGHTIQSPSLSSSGQNSCEGCSTSAPSGQLHLTAALLRDSGCMPSRLVMSGVRSLCCEDSRSSLAKQKKVRSQIQSSNPGIQLILNRGSACPILDM